MFRLAVIATGVATVTAARNSGFAAKFGGKQQAVDASNGAMCNGMTYTGPSGNLNAVQVAQIWNEVVAQLDPAHSTGLIDVCAAAVTTAYGESSSQQSSQGSGCDGGLTGACFNPSVSNQNTVFGLWQVTYMMGPKNQYNNWPTLPGCDAQYGTPAAQEQLKNPCCNAYVASQLARVVCVPGGDAVMNTNAKPFCQAQWTGGKDHYSPNRSNAEQACSQAAL